MSLNLEINSDRYSPDSQDSGTRSPGADRHVALAGENELLRRELALSKRTIASLQQSCQQSVASLLQQFEHTEQKLRESTALAVQLNGANQTIQQANQTIQRDNQTIQNYNTLLCEKNKKLKSSNTLWKAIAVFALVMWIYNHFRFLDCKPRS